MKAYTLTELESYFEAVNCIQDLQVLAEYLHDNVAYYSKEDHEYLRDVLRMYIQLWV